MAKIPHPNVPLPTFGGKQFWADLLHFRGWRVQQQAITGHHRLLSPNSVRNCWGSYNDCVAKLESVKQQFNLPPYEGEVVITIHGLFRARSSMAKIGKYLHDTAGYEVCNVSHPSTRCDIATHAQHLAAIVAGLSGAQKVHFVGHSLGNIIVRRYLAERAAMDGDSNLPAIGRVVMIAAPNQGAQIARRLAPLGPLHLVLGKAFSELGRDWANFEKTLATPREFGIIAGGRGKTAGFNPLLTGDDDLIVSVEETRLDGAADFLVFPAMHAFIMNHAEVQRQTAFFLQHGHFDRADRHGI